MSGPPRDAPRIFEPDYYEKMRRQEAEGWWNAGMRDAERLLLEFAALPEEGTLLDVGCGSGQTVRWLLGRLPGWRALGLDVSLEGLRAAHGLLRTRSSALALPHPAGFADLCVSLDVVQHLPLEGGDERALREMWRILRPGGFLLLRTNAQAFPRGADDPEYDFRRYVTGDLRGKLTGAGFEIVRLGRLNALLGLAEIPRDLRAARREGSGYHGILSRPAPAGSLAGRLKRSWLRLEGRAVRAGLSLPGGRAHLALCRKGRG